MKDKIETQEEEVNVESSDATIDASSCGCAGDMSIPECITKPCRNGGYQFSASCSTDPRTTTLIPRANPAYGYKIPNMKISWNTIPNIETKYLGPIPVISIPHLKINKWPTLPIPYSKVTDATYNFIIPTDPIDPVCSGPIQMFGVGIGYNRSRTVLVKIDGDGFIGEDECPVCEFDYHMHINRLTEQPIFLRETTW